jgi:imidazolonepropionase-like amidohydrolase
MAELGRLEVGAPADLVAWDADHEGAFALRLGALRPHRLWIDGREIPTATV